MSASGFPWRTALFVSLAFNLVLVSAAVGAFASGARLERPVAAQAGPRALGQRAFMDALPEEARRELRRDLAASLVGMRTQRRAARQARLALFEAARAEPYDVARVRAAFADVRAADAEVVGAFHESVAEAFGRLDPEERRTALDALTRRAGERRQRAQTGEP
jgi:uncharacterized membrane protein